MAEFNEDVRKERADDYARFEHLQVTPRWYTAARLVRSNAHKQKKETDELAPSLHRVEPTITLKTTQQLLYDWISERCMGDAFTVQQHK